MINDRTFHVQMLTLPLRRRPAVRPLSPGDGAKLPKRHDVAEASHAPALAVEATAPSIQACAVASLTPKRAKPSMQA